MARTGKVVVIINPTAMQTWLETNPGALAALGTTSKAVERSVVQAAPVGVSLSWPWRRPMRHGLFKRSIRTTTFRTWFRVYSTDAFAHIVEWGSVKNPPYAPFRRTLRAFRGTVNPEKHTGDPWDAPASPATGRGSRG
jgi:hypothetical protein